MCHAWGMVFSSPVFLFLFLPLTLGAYFVSPMAVRNLILLGMSLLFYAWQDELYVLNLLGSVVLNYGTGLVISVTRGGWQRAVFWFGISANLLMLGYYKYIGFIFENLGFTEALNAAPLLPIGISFFTFQALSYLIDLRSGRFEVQRNPLKLALYIALFPQLIAGPIVRYTEINIALTERWTTRDDFSSGMQQFVRGLAKKTLIADPLGLVADQIYALPLDALSPETAWLGAVSYAFQLYFDFSAYSDMAIGLGRIFGFSFPKNFDYPYTAQSVTEFWRRWHMTLSRWFRDYLYIPLGGSQVSAPRLYLNLWIVFLATGIWHGAAWTFVAWGAFHGVLLILERIGLQKVLMRAPRALRHVYLLLAVLVGWVLFRAESFGQAGAFYGAMFLLERGNAAEFYPLARYFSGYVGIILVTAAVFSVGARPKMSDFLTPHMSGAAQGVLREGTFWLLFFLSVVSVGAASYSPFIYFRF